MFQEHNLDAEVMRAWQHINELAEQIGHNQKIVAALQSQAQQLKDQAIHNGSGYSLRRFNVDLTKESFELELERTNAQIIIENQSLLHENKQLSVLLKEYEQTLETVMSKFRNHAVAAQQHELTLTRHYETLLLTRDAGRINIDLSSNSNVNASLQRLTQHIRMLMRSINGEDIEYSSAGEGQTAPDGNCREGDIREDWTFEREEEIARLEKENEELRRILGINAETAHAHGITDEDLADRKPCIIQHPTRHTQSLTSESWERLNSPSQTHSAFGQTPIVGNGGNGGNTAGSTEILQNQRTFDMQGSIRGGTVRRPSLFGRGRGNAPALWGPPPQERGWNSVHGNNGSGLDLMG